MIEVGKFASRRGREGRVMRIVQKIERLHGGCVDKCWLCAPDIATTAPPAPMDTLQAFDPALRIAESTH